jgi:hypothetical protein
MRAAPVVHSPPMPRPRMKRKMASWGMVCDRPQAKLAIEYIRIEPMSARVRPILSARRPKLSPPIAEANRVRELRRPACGLLIPRCATRSARTIEYSITSMASSIHPRPPAMRDRRSATVMRAGHSRPRMRRVAVSLVMGAATLIVSWPRELFTTSRGSALRLSPPSRASSRRSRGTFRRSRHKVR